MTRYTCVVLTMLACVRFAPAQLVAHHAGLLGPHYVSGRACGACHAPHTGYISTGAGAPSSRVSPLWGEDVTSLYKTITRRSDPDGVDARTGEAEPEATRDATPDVPGMLSCLSCHDGNMAAKSMMQDIVYEKLPKSGIRNLFWFDSPGASGYLSDHPVGLDVKIGCGGDDQWDCTSSEGVVVMRGTRSKQFVSNYGFFLKPASYNNTPVVVCTTCHDPHAMNVVNVGSGTRSGLPKGDYASAYFLRAPYNPSDQNHATNQTAQFCRQCHAALSNEMNGGAARTIF